MLFHSLSLIVCVGIFSIFMGNVALSIFHQISSWQVCNFEVRNMTLRFRFWGYFWRMRCICGAGGEFLRVHLGETNTVFSLTVKFHL